MKEAARTSSVATDERTPDADRVIAVNALLDRLWGSLAALADVVDGAIELVRRVEPDLLSQLKMRLVERDEAVVAAENALAAAKRAQFCSHRLGQWVQKASDDGPGCRELAPTGDQDPPHNFHPALLDHSLSRPWSKGTEPPALPEAHPRKPVEITEIEELA